MLCLSQKRIVVTKDWPHGPGRSIPIVQKSSVKTIQLSRCPQPRGLFKTVANKLFAYLPTYFSLTYARIGTSGLYAAWTDLAKLHHFGKFMRVYFVFGKILNLLWQNYHAIEQFFIVVSGQILKELSSHLVTLIVGIVSMMLPLLFICLKIHDTRRNEELICSKKIFSLLWKTSILWQLWSKFFILALTHKYNYTHNLYLHSRFSFKFGL